MPPVFILHPYSAKLRIYENTLSNKVFLVYIWYNKMNRRTVIISICFAALLLFLSSNTYSQWQRLATTGNVPHLKNVSSIYDPLGNRIIVFGGRTATGIDNSMYSLNLANNSWSVITPSGGTVPSARYTADAYYDINTNSMFIWSGQGNQGALYNDVWVFNLVSNVWSRVWPDSNQSGVPLRRYGTASMFEPVSGKITTFAGFTSIGRFEDTWTFDVNSKTWQDRTNTPHPPKRCLHSGVYANDLGRFVIYAGQDDNGPRDDIWQCNLSSFVWGNITPAVKPPSRFWNSIIYYSGGNILIFGGLGTAAMNDMWKFRMGTNSWEQISQGGSIPGARWGHGGIYIASQDRMIIFGGEGDSLYNDTWQYSNVSVIGIEPVSNEVPEGFKLEQNYPNPFNPVTKIKFSIPNVKAQMSNTRLSIFDAAGKLVSELLDKSLQAGEYEIGFDASGLPSGVYYYRLESGSYKETRKMVLLK